jgi:hypothetical protein
MLRNALPIRALQKIGRAKNTSGLNARLDCFLDEMCAFQQKLVMRCARFTPLQRPRVFDFRIACASYHVGNGPVSTWSLALTSMTTD